MYRRRKYLCRMSRKLKTIKHMSVDELKSKLYAHFEKNGSLDQLRAQLRGQLVTELFKVAMPMGTSKTYPEDKDFDLTLLPLQVSNWLVYDHLSRQGCQYALSTFVTEANLSDPEKLLTVCDILKLFGLDNNSPEYKSFIKMYATKNEEGFSHSLLLTVIKSLFEISHKGSVLKLKTNEGNFKETTSKNEFEKDLLDLSFPNGLKENEQNTSYDSMVAEPSRFRKQSMNASHPLTTENKSAESSFYEQLQYVKEENEKEVQKLRHKLLQELDSLHSREQKMRQDMELEKKELKKERDKLLVEIQKLGEKELLLEKEYENKFQKQLREMEIEFASKMHIKEREFESLQNKLIEKEQRLVEIESELTSQRERHNILKTEVDELKHMLKTTQGKYSSLLDENTNLLKKFEGMSDYDILKEELSAKLKEISDLQCELAEVHKRAELEKQTYTETLRILEDKLKSQNPVLQQTQRELNFTKDKLQMEELVWNKEKRKLEQEINISKELYKDVINRIEEQRGDIQDLHRTIHILHYQITNNSNPTNLSELKMPLATTKAKSAFFKDSPQKYREYSLKFIAETKDRIDKLQQETGALQDKCSYVFSAVPAKHHRLESRLFDFKTKPTSSLKSGSMSYNRLDSLDNVPKNYFDSAIRNELLLNSNSRFHAESKSLLSGNYTSKNHYMSSKNGGFIIHPTDNNFHNQKFKELSTESAVSNSVLESCSLNFSQNQFTPQVPPEHIAQDTSRFEMNSTHNSNKPNVLKKLSKLQEYNTDIVTDASKTQNVEVKTNSSEVSRSLYENSTVISGHNLKISPKNNATNSEKESDQFIDNEYRYKLTAENFQLTDQTEKESACSTAQEKAMDKIETTVHNPKLSDQKETENINLQETVVNETTDNEVVKNSGMRESNKAVTKNSTPELLFSEPDSGINLPVINLDEIWKRKSSISNPSSQITETNILVSHTVDISSTSSFKNSEISHHNKQFSPETEMKCTSPVSFDYEKAHSDHKEQVGESSDLIHTSVIAACDKNDCAEFNTFLNKEKNTSELKNVVHEPGSEMAEYQVKDIKEKDTSELKIIDSTEVSLSKSITRHIGTTEDSEVQINTKSTQEQVSAESLSELSEVHLSCGSEQEQQKDDSDFW